MPDITGFNEYFGWYGGATSDFGPFADNLHAAYPTRCVGISEYGAGASIIQHSEEPLSAPAPYGTPHPEEWQNKFHEDYWLAMEQRPYLWIKTVWNMFDFAVDGRNEGDTPGRNDKGLVTYDRLVRKDAFYWYKANWTTNAMVYITGHTFTNRLTNAITAKVYANCDAVELFLNGASQGTRTSTTSIFTWSITLVVGSNYVQAVGTKGVAQVSDSVVWFAPFSVAIARPAASVVFLNSTSDVLQLVGAVPNSGVVSTTWTQTSGSGVVTFGESNAVATTARFSAEGVYGLRFSASNGTIANAGLTVVVNPTFGITNGLEAWWKMDESGGSTAADSSGNSRTATLTGATFTSGYISNALQFNGTTGRGIYSAQDTNQFTVAAWARADAQGNSQFPRIVEAPGFRLMFRFGSSDVNSVGFASQDSTNGDWDSGGGSVSLGQWYHVAVSYDRSSQANLPVFYVNGIRRATVTLTMPSGTRPPYSGTAYIGNRSALDRAWSGLIDDLRIYNRLLTDAEVQALAAMPPANVAPAVNAGTNQSILWPGPANLNGTLSDDGEPNPPGVATVAWSQLSGLGPVTFANSNLLATAAIFSAPGLYALQLLADDGQIGTVGTVSISVVSPPRIGVQLQPGQLHLSWSNNGAFWQVQAQTNPPDLRLSSNWVVVGDVSPTNQITFPIDRANGSVFYRLVTP